MATPMMSVWREGTAGAFLHRSNQGCQLPSEQGQRLLIDKGILSCLLSRAGNGGDRAVAASPI
jgi:hypothetical protein